jgi:hypothetical protein
VFCEHVMKTTKHLYNQSDRIVPISITLGLPRDILCLLTEACGSVVGLCVTATCPYGMVHAQG